MTFALPPRRALYALAGLAAAYAAPAFAYDDKSTVTSVMELVGVSTDDGVSKIDYSERAKLVLPPRVGDLPPPVERTRAEPANDDFSARRRAAERLSRVNNAQPQAPQQGVLERALSFGSSSGSSVAVNNEPDRVKLSEPPSGYRRPTQDLSKIRDPDAKKGSWWNPATYLGGGDQTATASSTQSASSGASSGSSSWMPSFLRGSDKD